MGNTEDKINGLRFDELKAILENKGLLEYLIDMRQRLIAMHVLLCKMNEEHLEKVANLRRCYAA